MGKFLIHVIFSSNFGKSARFEEIMGKISAVFLLKTNKIKLLMVIINFHKNSFLLYFLTCDELHLFPRIHQQEVVVVWREVHPFFQWWLTTGLRCDLAVGIFFLHKVKPSVYLFIFPMMWDMSDSKEKQKKMNFWCSGINIEKSTYFSRNTITGIQTHQVCLHGWCL